MSYLSASAFIKDEDDTVVTSTTAIISTTTPGVYYANLTFPTDDFIDYKKYRDV